MLVTVSDARQWIRRKKGSEGERKKEEKDTQFPLAGEGNPYHEDKPHHSMSGFRRSVSAEGTRAQRCRESLLDPHHLLTSHQSFLFLTDAIVYVTLMIYPHEDQMTN